MQSLPLAELATELFRFNPTKVVGVVSYLLAATASVLAAKRSGNRLMWGLIAAGMFYVAVDIQLGLRHQMGAAFSAVWTSAGLRNERRPFQEAMLLGLGVVVVLGLVVGLIRVRRAAFTAKVAAVATGLTFGLIGVEMLSLHATDALLYRSVPGPVLAIGYAWAVLAGVVVLAGMGAAAKGKS